MSKNTKIVFLGTKEIGSTCFHHLINCRDQLDYEITAVLTNDRQLNTNSETVVELAKTHQIPIIPNLSEFLKLDTFDIAISIQYHAILDKIHLDKAKRFNVNLHMAPLPEYRGCNQFSFALINDDAEFGTTLHLMDEGIDSGDIIAQRRFPIPSNFFINELYELTFQESLKLFKETLPKLISGDFSTYPQSSFANKKPEIHYRSEIHKIKEISPNWESGKIIRHIRACAMPGFSPPFMKVGNKKITFTIEDN